MRIRSLDGIRGVAIILVLLDHFRFSGGFSGIHPTIDWIFATGNLGVRAFLVLSGFLISGIILKEHQKQGKLDLANFFLRRTVRLAPVYYAYLFVVLGIWVAGLYEDHLSSMIGSFSYLRNYLGSGDSLTIHLWSLSIEAQFYLVWPLLFALLGLSIRKRAVSVLLFVVTLTLLIRCFVPDAPAGGTILDRLVGERSILRYLDSLAIGVAGGYFFSASHLATSEKQKVPMLLNIAGVLSLPLMMILETMTPQFLAWLKPTLQAFLSLFVILLCCRSSSWVTRLFTIRPLVSIGMISYSLYIWHLLFVYDFVADGSYQDWKVPQLIHWVYSWNIWLFPSFGIAWLSYALFEKPFMQMRSRLRIKEP